jgi:hypothetical protein
MADTCNKSIYTTLFKNVMIFTSANGIMGTESEVSPQVQGITKINVPPKATPRVVVHESWLCSGHY